MTYCQKHQVKVQFFNVLFIDNDFIQSVPKKKDESIAPLFMGGF
jgi:hypothetical protein